MEHFIVKLCEVLDVEENEINQDSHFKDFDQWDSLTLLSLLAMVKETYGVILQRKDIDGVGSVKDLYDMVIAKQ